MRFLKYNEKIILLVLSLLLIGLLTITIYFTMNYEQLINENISFSKSKRKIAILNTQGSYKNINDLSKRINIRVYDKIDTSNIVKKLKTISSMYSVFIIVIREMDIYNMAGQLNSYMKKLSKPKPVILTTHHGLKKLVKTRFQWLSPELMVYNFNYNEELVNYQKFLSQNI